MADQVERLGLILNLAEQGMDIVHSFANDPLSAGAIQTGSGPIKNLKQVSADIKLDGQASIDVAVTELIDTLKTDTAVDALIVGLTDTAILAEQSAARSELSASVAAALAHGFLSIADGLAATSGSGATNRLFSVSSTGDTLAICYQNNAGIAVKFGEAPSALALKKVADNFQHIGPRSGYVWGVLDLLQRLGIGLTADGKLDVGTFRDVVGHILALEAKMPLERNPRAGYLWGVMDLMNRLALALDRDGYLINKGRNILLELDDLKDAIGDTTGSESVSWTSRSGYLWGVLDLMNRLALALDADGNLINKGRNILAELDAVGDSKWQTPSKDIASWGDSMSENSWQPYLRTLMPERNIYAGGIGGQKSGQIARRQGGIAPILSIAGNTIPASGGVMVTVDVPFLNNSTKLLGRLYGVFGTLSSFDGVHTFTRAVAGTAVQIDELTPFIISASDYDYDFRTAIFWSGNNDTQSIYRPEVDGNVTRMVEFLKPQDKRFIVIGMAIASDADRLKGTPYYTDTMALHKKWRERWPNNFIDITAVLQRHYDPNNPTDVQNLIDGCIPSSLRSDTIHLNEAGKQIVANHIYNFMLQRGW